MTRYCPFCGTPNEGAPVCPSCQAPLPGEPTTPSVLPGEVSPAPQPSPPQTLAGLPRRFLALLTDWVILGIVADLISIAYGIGAGRSPWKADGALGADAGVALAFALTLLYFTLTVGDGGQTVGKRLFGVRVVRVDGTPVGRGQAFLRALAYFASMAFFGLGMLWAAWDRRKQTWHDKIAGTIVVRSS